MRCYRDWSAGRKDTPRGEADGRTVPVEIGNTTAGLEGQEFPTPVIFAEEGEPRRLDAMALDDAGIGVDPANEWLVLVNPLSDDDYGPTSYTPPTGETMPRKQALWKAIHHARLRGASLRGIARELGMSRKTGGK